MNDLLSTAIAYIAQLKAVLLITVDENNVPLARPVGPFVNNGLNVYFWTSHTSEKIKHISINPVVTLYFQKEAQDYGTFTNLSVIGAMSLVTDEHEIAWFNEAMSREHPKFHQWLLTPDSAVGGVYRIMGRRIRYTDNTKKPNRVEEIIEG